MRKAQFEAVVAERDALKSRLEAIQNADPDPEADTSPRVMRKVLGQKREADCGPAEAVLRGWLEKDPKGFIAAIEEKEWAAAAREKAARGEEEGEDLGVARVRDVVGRLLKEFETGG